MKLVTLGPRLPRFILFLLSRFIIYILKDVMFGSILAVSKWKSTAQSWNAVHERDEFVKAFRKAVSGGW